MVPFEVVLPPMKRRRARQNAGPTTRRVMKEISTTVWVRHSLIYLFETNLIQTSFRGECLQSRQRCRGYSDGDHDQRSRSGAFANLPRSADLQIRLAVLIDRHLQIWRNRSNRSLVGIYRHVYGKGMEYHAVKIIGWGEENQVPYWLVANVWGQRWGMEGFFKILRGYNTAEIEAHVMAGIPAAFKQKTQQSVLE